MIVTDLFETQQTCPECGGPAFSDLILAEKKDACYHKVKATAKVWPSAYASGRLVQCRKKGAANWGNKSKNESVSEESALDNLPRPNKRNQFRSLRKIRKQHGLDEQGVAEGSLKEFAPSDSDDGGDDGFSEETLKRLAAQWYNGDEDPRVERTLMAAGWEIGQDEGYDDEPGVFVVQRGDVNGNSYISWPAHELKKGVTEGLNEFAPAGGGGGNTPRGPRTPGGDPWGGDDSGEDPYGTPKPRHYARSSSYFEQFEADHFDDEVFDAKTGVFKGYWDDEEGRVQIAYFKFDDPTRTGGDDPGMGWYYEPTNEGKNSLDPSGLIAAASQVRDFIITAEVDGQTKKFRVRGMTGPVAAKQRFLKHHDQAKVLDVKSESDAAEGIEGEIAGGAIGGLVGGAAGSQLGPIGGALGSAVGGSVGSAIGSRYQDGKPLKEKQQLDEFAPLLAAGARLFMAAAPKIAQVVGRAGRAGAQGAGQAAKTGAEIAAKNAGQIGLGAGAYEIGSSVADIAKDITAKVGQAVDEKTVLELATLAFKYAIPVGIVLAILYGGKKAIDSLFSDAEPKNKAVAEGSDDDVWGPSGRYAGDTKVDVGNVSMKKIQAGDTVRYFGELVSVISANSDDNHARINAYGKTMNVKLSDLKPLGQGSVQSIEEFAPAGGDGGDNYGGNLYDVLMGYLKKYQPQVFEYYGRDTVDSTVSDMIVMGQFSDIDPNNIDEVEDAIAEIFTQLADQQDDLNEGIRDWLSKPEEQKPQSLDMVFYVKNPDGTKTYINIVDAEQLARAQQRFQGRETKTLSLTRKDVLDWLEQRGVNLRKFIPGSEITVGALTGHQGMTEGGQDDEKIAGRYDPDEFHAMVRRLRQRAEKQEKERGPVDIAKLAQRLRDIERKQDSR